MKTISTLGFLAVFALALSGSAADSDSFRFKGTVVDAAGNPTDGATIESYSFTRGFTSGEMAALPPLVDTKASFELKLSGQGTLVIAKKEGFAPAWRAFLPGNGDSEGQLALRDGGLISGKVVDASDKPVANAEVFVEFANLPAEQQQGSPALGYLFGKPARDLFSARTGSDGEFVIRNFPTNASAQLAVDAGSLAMRRDDDPSFNPNRLPCVAGDKDIKLVVEPGGVLEGKVTAQDQAQPPTAKLVLVPERGGFFGTGQAAPAVSSPDGTFRITGVAAGNYRLRAEFGTGAFPDWVADIVQVSAQSGQTNTDIAINAIRGGALEIALVDSRNRKPLPQTPVSVYAQGYQAAGASGADGIALFRLPAGSYQVSASRQTARAQNVSATVENGKTNRMEMELAAPLRLQGIVRRPDGQPAPGVEVRVVGSYGGSPGVTKTDSDGRFELPFNLQLGSLERSYCLLARDPERNLAIAEDVDEETGPLDVKLAEGITLAGRAECDGAPVTNATAALIFWTGRSGMHLTGLAVGTNTPGHFEIPALPPGRRYGVYVSAPGFGQKGVYTIEYEDGQKRVEMEPTELKPANLKLAGQVLDPNDKPVASASIHLSGDGQPSANTTSDRQGHFAFNNVCEGQVRLFASSRNMQGSVSAQGGDTNVVVKLGESSATYASSTLQRIRGTVTDPEGKPVGGALIAVFPSHGTTAKTAADGSFNLNWSIEPWQLQQGGDPWLVVREMSRNLAAATNISEGLTNLSVQLKPGVTFAGRVEDSGGAALPNAEIELMIFACRSYSQLQQQPVRANAEGRFEVKALAPGPKYVIYAGAKDYGRSRLEIEEEPNSETNHVELPVFALKRADQVIAGEVLNEQEKPASGIQVSISGEDQPQGSATTDKQGRFRFKVCEGQVQLYAHGQNSYANTQVEAGETNIVLQLRGYDMASRSAPRRSPLKGKPLPDLADLGVTPENRPAGKALLLCLMDAEQRPSRRSARLLSDQCEALGQKGIAVLAIQTVPVAADSIHSWTNSAPLAFPLCCVKEKTPRTRWATEVESLPWLILCDDKGKVADEGFSIDDLPDKLAALKD